MVFLLEVTVLPEGLLVKVTFGESAVFTICSMAAAKSFLWSGEYTYLLATKFMISSKVSRSLLKNPAWAVEIRGIHLRLGAVSAHKNIINAGSRTYFCNLFSNFNFINYCYGG